MKRFVFFLSGLLVSFSAVAAIESDELYIVGTKRSSGRAVYLRKKADYVAVPLIIPKDPKIKEAEKQVYFQRKIASSLVEAAKKSKSPLVVKFVGLEKQPYVYLMTKLDAVPRDMAYYLKKINTLYKPLFFTGKSKCQLGAPVLAVKDPEKHRADIIRKIIYSVESLTTTLNSSVKIEISGLERAVAVKSVDDENVDLHIPYTLSIEIERGK